jgi:protoporphyrinogen oxidase
MKIAVIGGGLTGLALALRLSREGCTVTVFEREARFGGLATWQEYGAFDWDRFYHVILPSDVHLLAFLRDIGLGTYLRWARTLTGFFVDRTFHSLSSGLDFLRFKPVNFWGKARLAFTILYCSRISNWRRLEQIPVGDWLRRLSGRKTYEKLWLPLLLAKLGDNYRRVSAVFIWSYIKRMFSARDASTQKEQLGYVSGGYKSVLIRLEELIKTSGGALRAGIRVHRIAPVPGVGISVQSDRGIEVYDKVVFTGPTNVLEEVASEALCRLCRASDTKVEYLGVICLVLITRRPLVPYYVLNIADERIPFTGIIGMSNLVATDETAGLHLTYLPKYVHSEDPLLRASEEELRNLFLEGLRLMFPDFDSIGVEGMHIHRAFKVQPLQILGYSELVPTVTTLHPDFFVLNTAQFTANTLNNNEVIRAVNDFMRSQRAQLLTSSREQMKTSDTSSLHAEQAA